MQIIGVDPGAGGALAFFDTDTGDLEIVDMPTVEIKRGSRFVRHVSAPLLADIIRGRKADAAFVEKVGAMPGQGVASMFAFGRAAGVIEGVLAALEMPITHVPPQEWIKAMRVVGGKDGSRQRATQVFAKQAGLFARKKDDGRSDAALLAAYGAKLLNS